MLCTTDSVAIQSQRTSFWLSCLDTPCCLFRERDNAFAHRRGTTPEERNLWAVLCNAREKYRRSWVQLLVSQHFIEGNTRLTKGRGPIIGKSSSHQDKRPDFVLAIHRSRMVPLFQLIVWSEESLVGRPDGSSVRGKRCMSTR